LNEFAEKTGCVEFTGIQSAQYDSLNEPGKILGTVGFTVRLKENLYNFDLLTRQHWLDDLAELHAQNAELWPNERLTVSIEPPATLVTRMKKGDTVSVRSRLRLG
jgi:hypothetical protein